jgi:hypothetical protein
MKIEPGVRLCHEVVVSMLLFGLAGWTLFAQEAPVGRESDSAVHRATGDCLVTEIRRVEPFYAIRHLARFQQMQNRMGGGFCGCMCEPIIDADEIPLPVDDAGVRETAAYLAKLRQANLAALAALGIPVEFVPAPFEGMESSQRTSHHSITVDLSVPSAFLEALQDDEVTMGEARAIARLPANRELLRFVCRRCRGTELQITEQTLTYLIWKAGSSEPLDRIWRWLNPMNDFGYADLAVNRTEYARLIKGLASHRNELEVLASSRIAPYLPDDASVDQVFVWAPVCFTGDWATPSMSGANLPQIKRGWRSIVSATSGGAFRGYIVRRIGAQTAAGSWNAPQGFDPNRWDLVRDLMFTTIVEGTVDFVSDPASTVDPRTIAEGAELFQACLEAILDAEHVEHPRALVESVRGDGSTLGRFGRHLAGRIAERDGRRAVTELVERGGAAFVRRAVEIELDDPELTPDLKSVYRDVVTRLRE